MIKKNEIWLNKIKVNVYQDQFWIVPPLTKIFSSHRYDYALKNAKTIEEIIKFNKLIEGNYYFSFNNDNKFKLFNSLQKNTNLNIEINSKVIKEIELRKKFFFEITGEIKILIDEKSLYHIFKGNAFFVDLEYLKLLVSYYKQFNKNQKIFTFKWIKKEFALVKDI